VRWHWVQGIGQELGRIRCVALAVSSSWTFGAPLYHKPEREELKIKIKNTADSIKSSPEESPPNGCRAIHEILKLVVENPVLKARRQWSVDRIRTEIQALNMKDKNPLLSGGNPKGDETPLCIL
jgi:hypothetical protein